MELLRTLEGRFLVLKVLFVLALPRLGVLVSSTLSRFVALIPGAGVRCPFLSSRASWRRRRTTLPLLLGLRASLYRPNQTRDNRNGRLLYPVRAVRCSLVRFAVRRQRCERFLFAAGCSTKELSKTTVSFWLRMPALGYGTVCLCPVRLVHSCCCSVSSLRRTWLSSWWRARMWHSHTSLRCCCLGAVTPQFLAAFHRACVVAVQALVLPGPARLDISLLTDWTLALGSCFLVRSPTIRRHPMRCHG